MMRSRNLILAIAFFFAGLIGTLVWLREPTTALTLKELLEAKNRWRAADIRTYRVKYRMHDNLYEVWVMDGLVEEITVNGKTPNIVQASAYSVEGLFHTLEEELENVSQSGGPQANANTSTIARVRFDEQLGYPRRYVRGATGLSRGSSLEMLEFEPKPRHLHSPNP